MPGMVSISETVEDQATSSKLGHSCTKAPRFERVEEGACKPSHNHNHPTEIRSFQGVWCCLNIRMLYQGVPSSPCLACYKAMAASAAGNASHGNSQCDLYLPQGADVLLIEYLSLSITLCSYNECCHPLLFAENCLAYCFRPRCNSLSKKPRRLHVWNGWLRIIV